tara:strand:+ start:406 stop:1047 length:642 start_codon:yes stop_codon:yes gene_type:complete
MNKNIIGFAIVYIIILYVIPHILYKFAKFTSFITYIANVDLLANVLATNIPSYFKYTYDNESKTLLGYLSFNIISLYALSGIFLYGLQLKLVGHNNNIAFKSMIAVSIITFTLPTLLIPFLTRYIKKQTKHIATYYIKGKHVKVDETNNEIKLTDEAVDHISIIVSSVIALLFILVEGYFIEHFIHKDIISKKGLRVFGIRHNNPLETLFKDT